MADSDASSDMSDDALNKLVSRLVEAGGDLDQEDAETLGVGQNAGLVAKVDIAAENDSAESEGGIQLGAGTGYQIWPTSPIDQPSPIQTPRRSPRSDEQDLEGAVLASADATDISSGVGQPEPPMALARSTGRGADADSRGYERDVGETTSSPSNRRPSTLAVISPPGVSAKPGVCEVKQDGSEEGHDECSGMEASNSQAHEPASLDMTEARRAMYSAPTSSSGGLGEKSAPEEHAWQALNETLREQGFKQVPVSRPGGSIVVPDLADLTDTLREVLFQHGDRGKIIHDMSMELSKHNLVAGHRDQVLNNSFRRERSDLHRRSEGAEARVRKLEQDNGRLQDELAKETRRLKTENANLASQLKQSEHRVKAMEAAAQGLRDKLEDEVEKERLSQLREREVLKKLHQKEGRGGSLHDSSASKALSARSRAQERAEAELDSLRAEVARLGDELREKENTILRHRLGPDWTPGLDGNPKDTQSAELLPQLRDRLAESDRNLRVVRAREARVQERCAHVQEERQNIQTELDETRGSLENAQMELTSRPSLRNWRASQRRIQDLERKLAQANTQAKEALDTAELRRWVDTRELMRRDKENHKLKLDRLDELPSIVMKQVVQDACRLLALEDVSLLGPSVDKLTKAVQVLPRLERFVNSVCLFVFRHSAQVLSSPADGSFSQILDGRGRTMEDVLPLLELWLARAQEPAKLEVRKERERLLARVAALRLMEFHCCVLKELEARADPSQAAGSSYAKSDRAIVSTIRHLVELEQRSLKEVHFNQHADWSLNDDPDLPVNRVVRHFQLLFGVKSIVGCTAKLNEVYRFSSEAQTFFRTAGDLMYMPNATAESVMKRLEAVLQRRQHANPDACLRVSNEAELWTAAQSPPFHPTEA